MFGKIGHSIGAIGGKVLGSAKVMMASPAFAVIALGGIIGYELWKGSRDAREIDALNSPDD
ncbi:MAG: hypothetical protein GY859_34575 [Desulfobacterales bacterium]|nr:hypothetical protein [Desulfobacterales bacterium]